MAASTGRWRHFSPGSSSFGSLPSCLEFGRLSALAAWQRPRVGWHRLEESWRIRAAGSREYSAALLAITIVALVVATAGRQSFDSRLARPYSRRFRTKPIAARAAFSDLCRGLVQGGLILVAALALALRKTRPGPVCSALALLAVTADLASANARHVVTIPQRLLEATPRALEMIDAAERANPTLGPGRVHRLPFWEPIGWTQTSSPDREREFVAWERDTLLPKYGIPLGVDYTLSPGAAELRDYTVYFDAFVRELEAASRARVQVKKNGPSRSGRASSAGLRYVEHALFHPPVCSRQVEQPAARVCFVPASHRTSLPCRRGVQVAPGSGTASKDWIASVDFQVRRNLDCFPRAWVVHDAHVLTEVDDRGRGAAATWLDEILFSEDDRWRDPSRAVHDPRSTVWIEPENRADLAPFVTGGKPAATERVHVLCHGPDRVELKADLGSPWNRCSLRTFIIPAGNFDRSIGRPAPLYRANRMMRGAAVDAGCHSLVFTYRPESFRAGLICSCVGLATLTVLGLASTRALSQDPVPHKFAQLPPQSQPI